MFLVICSLFVPKLGAGNVEYTFRSVHFGRFSGCSTVVLSRQFSHIFAALLSVDFLELVVHYSGVFCTLACAAAGF